MLLMIYLVVYLNALTPGGSNELNDPYQQSAKKDVDTQVLA